MTEPSTHQTLSLETHARNSCNYYQRMVDGKGQPYFNIFWIDPAEAAHDWPDFADVTARQLQAIIMLRRMTGISLHREDLASNHLIAHRSRFRIYRTSPYPLCPGG